MAGPTRWRTLSRFAPLPVLIDRLKEFFTSNEHLFGSNLNSPPIDVTGSRANPEQALKNVIAALAEKGIITDNTTV